MSEQPPHVPPQPPYAQQPGYYGYAAPPRRTADGAVTALVLGILGFVMCGLFTSIPAIVVGRRTTREIDASQGQLDGRGLAQAGFILGIVGTALYGLALVFVIIVFVFGGLVASTFESTCTTTDGSGQTVAC